MSEELFDKKGADSHQHLPNQMAPAAGMTGVAGVIDRLIGGLGKATSWLTLILVFMVAGDVLFRYVWHVSSVSEQELEWHVLGVITLIGASYTLQQGEHVRVDVLYQFYSRRVKQWLDVLIPLLVMLPTMSFIVWQSLHFVEMSWAIREGSPDPGGLPARYVIKAFVPIGFALIALEAFALTLSGITQLRKREPSGNE